jgi:hypothetical protein
MMLAAGFWWFHRGGAGWFISGQQIGECRESESSPDLRQECSARPLIEAL